ncbi:hypothetical protein [Nitratireductor rhodophyticola]|uniref:hypothetical protein n=1 Tax=Nitratireductor rhodophyticola TaxID=2854036 RepID=UPI003BA98D94
MAKNQQGIAIVIKAWLPTGDTIDEQFERIGLVKTAHETGDYAPVLSAAKIDEVKAEQKTRRVEEEDQTEPTATAEPEPTARDKPEPETKPAPDDDADIPEFVKGKNKAA